MILIMTGKQTFFMYKKRENYHVFRSKVRKIGDRP